MKVLEFTSGNFKALKVTSVLESPEKSPWICLGCCKKFLPVLKS